MTNSIQIETTWRCAGCCPYCPHTSEPIDMEDAVFDKVVKAIDVEVDAIYPFLNGDPLLDPKILPRLQALRAAFPHPPIHIYTTLPYDLFKEPELLGFILSHTQLTISITPSTAPIDMVYRLRPIVGAPGLTLVAPAHTKAANNLFNVLQELSGSIPNHRITPLFNWGGQYLSPYMGPERPCTRIDRFRCINIHGQLTHCCYIHKGPTYGSLLHNNLSDLVNKEPYVRFSTHQEELPQCRVCNGR